MDTFVCLLVLDGGFNGAISDLLNSLSTLDTLLIPQAFSTAHAKAVTAHVAGNLQAAEILYAKVS